MQHDERAFYRRGLVSSPQKPLDPEYVHTAASQQQEREEERRLPACQPRCERAAPVSRRVRRGQGDPLADIGVAAHLVGMRMVSVVLGNPPAKAQPDERVPHDEAEQAIAAALAENLVVPASWPMKPSWVNITPTNGATARAAHELPTMTNRTHPAKKAKIVMLTSPGSSPACGRADRSLVPAAPVHES